MIYTLFLFTQITLFIKKYSFNSESMSSILDLKCMPIDAITPTISQINFGVTLN